MSESIGQLVRKNENTYIWGQTAISKYVHFQMFENINKIDAYLNSKHISGDKDSLDRDKPFFNIVTAAVNIWYRATDIDRKDIRIKATKQSDFLSAFLATIHLQNWMRRQGFGMYLNEWGRGLARYGSYVTKFVEKDGELNISSIPWNRLICDTVDFDNNVKIEMLELTPAQLRENTSYDQDAVESLLDSTAVRYTLDRQPKDVKAGYIKLYEVHGNLPLSYLTGEETDKHTYIQQMHVVSFVGAKTKGGKWSSEKEYEDFTLFKGKEEKDPYYISHLIKEDGRTQAIGAVEHLFEAQWMANHSQKMIKDVLDFASLEILQTADASFVGKNALQSLVTGDVLVHAENQPLTQINNQHDITSIQAFGRQWEALAKEITSTPDSISGNTLPSGTAYRQAAMLNQESHSLFEIMTENKGLHLEEMLRKYIIPFLKKKMDTTDELAATLDDQGIRQIDSLYIPNEVIRRNNAHLKAQMLHPDFTGQETPPAENLDQPALAGQLQQQLNTHGDQRFIKPADIDSVTWKEKLKGLEWMVECDITNEASDKQTVMTTLTTVLQSIAGNPSILQDPNMKLLFNKILESTGEVSPVELAQVPPPPSQQNKVSESLSYKDAPDDVKRQIESQAGLKPSQQQTNGGRSAVKQPATMGG